MRVTFAAAAALCTILLASPASAQVAGKGGEAPVLIKTPPLGVRPVLRRGFFADLQVGTFFTLNGGASNGNKAVSNAEPLLGIALGYDITKNIQAGLGFAYGSSSGTCYATFDPSGTGSTCSSGADSFAVMTVNAYAGYLHPLTYEWYVGAKLMGGLALMTPKPVAPNAKDTSGMITGFDGGLVLTTEYHTHLDHFVVGLDIGGAFISGGSGVAFPGISIYPHLRYVF